MSKCCELRVGLYTPATARVIKVVVVGYLDDPQAADHQRHLYRLQATGGVAARRFLKPRLEARHPLVSPSLLPEAIHLASRWKISNRIKVP